MDIRSDKKISAHFAPLLRSKRFNQQWRERWHSNGYCVCNDHIKNSYMQEFSADPDVAGSAESYFFEKIKQTKAIKSASTNNEGMLALLRLVVLLGAVGDNTLTRR